jgi:hypothetical protein
VSKAIFEVVDRLPKNNVTTMMLNALDFVVPGQWQNLVGFDNTIKAVTGETDEQLIQQIGERAVYLFNDKSQGYQTALWLYQTVDSADSALGAAALANKVGEKISFLGFLDRITPNPDKAQSIDLQLKLVAELLAFCQINGIPGDSIGDFAASLGDYSGESLMRMAALVCVDGLIPLGPDFIQKVQDNFNNTSDGDLKGNPIFGRISKLIPGGSTGEQLGFIGNAFSSVSDWMNDFVSSRGLTPQMVFGNLRNFIDISDDKLDYVGAFLDLSTNYYEHTGTQTLARRLIERAVAEI